MDLKQIQELVKLVNKSNIGELSIEKEDFKITIKQRETQQGMIAMPQQQFYQPPMSLPPQTSLTNTTKETTGIDTDSPKADNYLTIKSPMIGTFYRQPGPDKEIFVNVGDEVEVGTVVCIIEAMKLFNEIESEISGKIVKVLVDDASPVEFDQPLFLVQPS